MDRGSTGRCRKRGVECGGEGNWTGEYKHVQTKVNMGIDRPEIQLTNDSIDFLRPEFPQSSK